MRPSEFYCHRCFSDRVTCGAVVNPNDPIGDLDFLDCIPEWCRDCDAETEIITAGDIFRAWRD